MAGLNATRPRLFQGQTWSNVMLSRLGRDGVAAIVLLILGALGWFEVSDYPPRAAIWPKWMLAGLIVLSLILLFQSIVTQRKKKQ
mgnify:CR=1 FL=1